MPSVAKRVDAPLVHNRPAGLVATLAALAAGTPAAALGDPPAMVTAAASAFVMADATDDARSPTERPAQDWDGLVSLAMGYLENAARGDRAPQEPDPAPTT
jgi:hypothetical protein